MPEVGIGTADFRPSLTDQLIRTSSEWYGQSDYSLSINRKNLNEIERNIARGKPAYEKKFIELHRYNLTKQKRAQVEPELRDIAFAQSRALEYLHGGGYSLS